MNTIINDLWLNVQSYSSSLIALLPKILVASLVFALLYFFANRSRNFVKRRLNHRMDDPLLATFLSRVVKIALVIIAGLIALQILGLAGMAAGIVTGASVSAIVIGFAFKDIGENFLAGIMLAFNRPFRVGDIVELDGHKGTVVALNLRNARIKTFDGKDIFIPNANVIKNPVVNYTMDGFLRYDFTIGLDYGSDVNKAIQIILETMKQVPNVLQTDKETTVAVSNLGASALELTVYYWLDTFDSNVSAGKVKTLAVDKTLQALDKAGFYLPGDILEMKNYKDENLTMKTPTNKNGQLVA